ncbi:MAG: hypothetical protein ACFCUG_08430 [Thiotrichales bacterium]
MMALRGRRLLALLGIDLTPISHIERGWSGWAAYEVCLVENSRQRVEEADRKG